MGPSLLWHLGGGEGGIQHFMDTLMGPLTAMWPTLGNPQITPEIKRKIIDDVLGETDGHSVDELAAQRDAMLLGLEGCGPDTWYLIGGPRWAVKSGDDHAGNTREAVCARGQRRRAGVFRERRRL